MQTKLGDAAPVELTAAISASASMLGMWERLRPSCQHSYVKLVAGAKREETRKWRIERVLRMTVDYCARHPESRKASIESAP
ncbi:MAG: YdeI/OmpD-associated family protein [Chloroflexi bacterium]|nr:YdeI/OmpD-associated family protein [Chloroflexota bacterium]